MRQINNSHSWDPDLLVAIIDKEPPTWTMRANNCAFPMACQFQADLDGTPMLLETRPLRTLCLDKFGDGRLFQDLKAIRRASDARSQQPQPGSLLRELSLPKGHHGTIGKCLPRYDGNRLLPQPNQ
jgi:hypothetical protein